MAERADYIVAETFSDYAEAALALECIKEYGKRKMFWNNNFSVDLKQTSYCQLKEINPKTIPSTANSILSFTSSVVIHLKQLESKIVKFSTLKSIKIYYFKIYRQALLKLSMSQKDNS